MSLIPTAVCVPIQLGLPTAIVPVRSVVPHILCNLGEGSEAVGHVWDLGTPTEIWEAEKEDSQKLKGQQLGVCLAVA